MNDAVALRPDLGGENFECPEGIKFVEIDSTLGLRSTVTCPVRELIAVSERMAPNLECYLHGNLPVQGSPFAEESETATTATTEFVARQPRIDKPLNLGTGVAVDSNGRRTLVNDMRE
jgi:hypothetical protein